MRKNDQPNLVYFHGTEKALLVDAGPSFRFSREVMDYLAINHLQKPSFVVVTNYHWDHSFGLNEYTCETISSSYTTERLKEMKQLDFTKDCFVSDKLINAFSVPHLKKEYPNLKEIRIALPKISLDNVKEVDLGNLKASIMPITSSHTKGSLIVICDEVVAIGDSSCEELIGEEFVENIDLLKVFLKEIKEIKGSLIIEGHSMPLSKKIFEQEIQEVIDNF